MTISFTRMTIFSRLIVSYLVIFFLLMAVNIYAIVKLHQFKLGTRHILNIDNRVLDYQKKLTDSLLSHLRYQKKFSITKDFIFYNQFLSEKAEFSKSLNEVLLIADTPDKKSSLDKIRTLYGRYQSLIEDEIEQVRNNPDQKRWFEREIEKAVDAVLEELKALEVYAQQDIYNRTKDLGESGASTRKLAIVMSMIAVLLAILTSFFITRNITNPLSILMEKTKEISKGIFKSDLNITSPPEMLELTKAFNLMCDKLKIVEKMKSDFFSSMSHELRTPLTSIKEGINLLQDGVGGEIPDRQKKLLRILSEESMRLIGLVNSLLDLSKMEAGMMSYTFDRGNPAPMIQKTAVELTPLAEAKKIVLKIEVDEKLPSIKMDRERILQVLRNLIGNALKFTPEGGQVRVSAQMIDREVKISVTDSGPGIPKENLTNIFEKFRQANLKNQNRIKGTGLGLAIVKHVITAHGGKVWAENESGQGSTFIFVLPA
jgi:two-component system sensor histidine kinase GlrK